MHDLQNVVGALQANFEFLSKAVAQNGGAQAYVDPNDVVECTDESQALLRQVARGLRTVQDFERFESGRMGLKPAPFAASDLLDEVCADVRAQLRASASGRATLTVEESPSAGLPLLMGDRDLLRRALAALVLMLHRQAGTTALKIGAIAADDGVIIGLRSNGAPISSVDEASLFDPFAPTTHRGPLAERFEMALARAIIQINRGHIHVQTDTTVAGFVVELRSKNSWPKSH